MVTLSEMEQIGKKGLIFLSNNSKTPLMKQYDKIKSNYTDSILLFRMGDFYETFSSDAIIVSELLGIVLTKRSNGKAADVDLAGFPYHALDNYLPKLVKGGYKVAICEQIEDPSQVKGIVKRKVIEVVTPGTITSEQVLNQKRNNFPSFVHECRNRHQGERSLTVYQVPVRLERLLRRIHSKSGNHEDVVDGRTDDGRHPSSKSLFTGKVRSAVANSGILEAIANRTDPLETLQAE